MEASEPALFRTFPSLRERIPRVPFVTAPTPVCAIPFEGLPRDCIFVKRDDRSCPIYGGNKPRKLEFVIGAARERGARRLVTTGALGTHHGLATTILGAQVGMATSLVLVDQPLTEEVIASLRLDVAYGAELIYASSLPAAAAHTLRVLGRSIWRGERPVLVPTGGSSALGNLGFVSAGLELAEQVRAGDLPEPAAVYIPVGSGGSAVGLLIGLKLAGLATRVRGVLVTDLLAPSERRLARAASATVRLLRRLSESVPPISIGPEDFPLLRNQLGEGYGHPTQQAEVAMGRAAQRGLRLDMTYSAKCLAALWEDVRQGVAPDGPIVFWNTFNDIDVAGAAPGDPTTATLPPRIQELIDRAHRPVGATA